MKGVRIVVMVTLISFSICFISPDVLAERVDYKKFYESVLEDSNTNIRQWERELRHTCREAKKACLNCISKNEVKLPENVYVYKKGPYDFKTRTHKYIKTNTLLKKGSMFKVIRRKKKAQFIKIKYRLNTGSRKKTYGGYISSDVINKMIDKCKKEYKDCIGG
jgi:hypothetical protein